MKIEKPGAHGFKDALYFPGLDNQIYNKIYITVITLCFIHYYTRIYFQKLLEYFIRYLDGIKHIECVLKRLAVIFVENLTAHILYKKVYKRLRKREVVMS